MKSATQPKSNETLQPGTQKSVLHFWVITKVKAEVITENRKPETLFFLHHYF